MNVDVYRNTHFQPARLSVCQDRRVLFYSDLVVLAAPDLVTHVSKRRVRGLVRGDVREVYSGVTPGRVGWMRALRDWPSAPAVRVQHPEPGHSDWRTATTGRVVTGGIAAYVTSRWVIVVGPEYLPDEDERATPCAR